MTLYPVFVKRGSQLEPYGTTCGIFGFDLAQTDTEGLIYFWHLRFGRSSILLTT